MKILTVIVALLLTGCSAGWQHRVNAPSNQGNLVAILGGNIGYVRSYERKPTPEELEYARANQVNFDEYKSQSTTKPVIPRDLTCELVVHTLKNDNYRKAVETNNPNIFYNTNYEEVFNQCMKG